MHSWLYVHFSSIGIHPLIPAAPLSLFSFAKEALQNENEDLGVCRWRHLISTHPALVVPGILAIPNLPRVTEEFKGYRIQGDSNKWRRESNIPRPEVGTANTLGMNGRHPGPNKAGNQAGKQPPFHGEG